MTSHVHVVYLSRAQMHFIALQVLLASGEGNLVLLEVSGGMLTEKSRTKLASDVACLDLSPIAAGRQRADLAAVGTWDHNVHVLCLPDLSVSAGTESLGGEVIPRSVLFTEFEGLAYLLVALGTFVSSACGWTKRILHLLLKMWKPMRKVFQGHCVISFLVFLGGASHLATAFILFGRRHS